MKEQKDVRGKGILIAEILVGMVLLVLWVFFFINRSCIWDTLALAGWGIILLLSALLLLRAEWKLRMERER